MATVPSYPQDPTTPLVSWTDLDPVLVPPYGTKQFFYRVGVDDAFGKLSAPSAVITGAVPDTTPPGPTDLIGATGDADRIRVDWKPNAEPDLAGYQIYRGVCDRGFIYRPGITHVKDKEGKIITRGESRYPCDMTLVGDVSVGDANAMYAADGRISFEDYSVPANSPLCYGYWVHAYDQAGNLYAGEQRLPATRGVPLRTAAREDAAASSGDDRPASPQQRQSSSSGSRRRCRICAPSTCTGRTRELDPPQFLACVFTDGSVSATPWAGLVPSCDDVPAVPDPLAARGSYLDDTAEPHRVYWYRVSALDWLGNESDGSHIADIPASSTFTYTTDLPVTPSVLPPVPAASDGCGLEVNWGPPFDPATLQGFVVFRAAYGRPVPAGLRDPDCEQLHRPLRAAWRRLPLRRPVDRPHRPPLPTLAAGPAPVLTSARRTPWASSTSSTPRATAGRSGTGARASRLQLGPVPAHLPRHQSDERSDRVPARRRVLPDLQELRRQRQLRRHVDARARAFQVRRVHGVSARRRTSTRPANDTDHKQPASADLHEAINIMQARQFSAPGIRNFLDVVKAGQLNDGVAAWNRIRSGLGSGDYCMLSLSNGLLRRRRPHGHPVPRRHERQRVRAPRVELEPPV